MNERLALTDDLIERMLRHRAARCNPADLPDLTRDAVTSTPQMRPLSGRIGRWISIVDVPRAIPGMAAVVGVIVVFVIGVALLGAPGRPGAGAASPSPSPSATPTPTPSSSLSPTDAANGNATVLAQFAEIHVGWVYLYADGRVVYHPDGPTYERRLTQVGVDLVRSGAVPVSAFLKDPGRLPTHAWADTEARPYEPAKYAICHYLFRQGAMGPVMGPEVDASEALERLPTPAQALLRGRERVFHPGMVEVVVPWLTSPAPPVDETRECWEVTADEGRVLFGILAAAGWSGDPNAHEPVFGEPSPADGSFDLAIDSELVLPHGVIQGWGG